MALAELIINSKEYDVQAAYKDMVSLATSWSVAGKIPHMLKNKVEGVIKQQLTMAVDTDKG